MQRKICKDCNIEKNIDEFYKNKTNKDEFNKDCKICYNNKRKEYLKEYEKRDYVKKIKSKKSKIRNYKKYHENIELSRKYNRENRKKQRDKDRVGINIKRREYYKHKMVSDPLFKLKKNIRNRIRSYTKFGYKSQTTFEIVGISAENLKIYIENKFIYNMSWENYGQYGWHIDHIIPLDSAKTKEKLYELCHYTNLQPMWWNDNLKKGSKILFL